MLACKHTRPVKIVLSALTMNMKFNTFNFSRSKYFEISNKKAHISDFLLTLQ